MFGYTEHYMDYEPEWMPLRRAIEKYHIMLRRSDFNNSNISKLLLINVDWLRLNTVYAC